MCPALALLTPPLLCCACLAPTEPEEDEGLRRKLWLCITQQVVQGALPAGHEEGGLAGGEGEGSDGAQAVHIKQAVELLKEAGGWQAGGS